MNIPTPAPGLRHPPGPRGVALVVTLMMMSVLVMMVVGLAGVMRNEQAAARNLTYQVIADQMADLGARVAMAAVLSNSTGSIGRPAASGPGWMCINGTAVGLFSSNASGQLKNLEEIGTNSLVLGLPDTTRGQLMASWSNLVGPAGFVIGRYAWWVDDEGTKVNLNAIGSNNTNVYLPLLTAFPISADYVFVDPSTGQTNNASGVRSRALAGRSNSLPTTESLKDTNITGLRGVNDSIGPTVYRRAKGHVTAWSSSTDLTPWGAAKLNLADPALTPALIKGAFSTNAWTNFFGTNMTLARKFGGGSLVSGSSSNHGDLVLDQIVANIKAAQGSPVSTSNQPNFANTSPQRHRGGLPLGVGSMVPSPYFEEVRVRVDYAITGNAAQSRIAFLVRVVNPYAQSFPNYSLRVLPRKFRFNVLPNGANIAGTPPPTSSQPLNGFVGPVYSGNVWAGPEWTAPVFQPWPLTSPFLSNSITYAARSRRDHILTCTITINLDRPPTGVPRAYVILDQIGLFASDTPDTSSLRDWLSAEDMSQAANFTATETGQMVFDGQGGNPAPVNAGATLPPLTAASFTAANSHGVRKIDPQVRFSLAYWNTNGTAVGQLKANGWPATAQAWSRTVPMAQSMTNQLLSYLPPDPAPGVSDILDHPHFVAGYRVTNGFKSVAQLGAIHTGIPWRTLRLQPQPAVERAAANGATNSPPDWILLDVFTATSPAASLPSINANGIPMAMAGGRLGVASNVNGTISSRSWSLASAMASAGSPISRNNTNAFATNGVPLSLTNAATAYANLGGVASNLTAALTNPSAARGWSINSDWRNARAGRAIYPANGFLLRGELLEVGGVAEDTSSPATLREDVIEGRLRSFLDLVSTRSDTFSVWSVGQGLQVVTNRGNRTNIMGEVRKQTVFQRVPKTNSSGTPTNYQLKLLYTRNHTVE